ncbi:hypothetical protein HaLaN_04375, partial [Haematococcus lacustris]
VQSLVEAQQQAHQALAARLDGAEKALAEVEKAQGVDDGKAALQQQVEQAEARLKQLVEQVEALVSRVDDVDTLAQSTSHTADALGSSVEAAEQKLAAADGRLAEVAKQVEEAMESLKAAEVRQAQLSDNLSARIDQLGVGAVEASLKQQQAAVQALQTKVDELAAATQQSAEAALQVNKVPLVIVPCLAPRLFFVEATLQLCLLQQHCSRGAGRQMPCDDDGAGKLGYDGLLLCTTNGPGHACLPLQQQAVLYLFMGSIPTKASPLPLLPHGFTHMWAFIVHACCMDFMGSIPAMGPGGA